MTVTLFILLLALLAAGITLQMAMPPDALLREQESAPEVLQIEIAQVTQRAEVTEATNGSEGERWVHIDVIGNVLAVRRSKRGVQVGDRVLIRWTIHSSRIPAAGDWASAPQVDMVYDAYLETSGEVTRPAAHSKSFEAVATR